MADRKSTEAEDVFEFLDSLPQTKNGNNKEARPDKKNTKAPVEGKQKQKGKNDEDILDFLDELEKSNLSLSKKNEVPEKHTESKNDKAIDTKETPTDKQIETSTETPTKTPTKTPIDTPIEDDVDAPLNDPITSLSNWWSSSGSAKVSSIWSKTTEQASNIKTRLANEQLDITSKLNTATITELARNLQKMVAGETDEVLRIHLVHDLTNFPRLQYNVEQKFDQVLSSQVQGGIRIFVDQWGHPHKSSADETDFGNARDGQRKLNIFNGKITDGEKLAFANLDNAIKLFDKAHQEYLKQQRETIEKESGNEDVINNTDGISDIFISILPIAIPATDSKTAKVGDIVTTDAVHAGNFSFTIILKDITNDISTITRSQGFPMKWVGWLEGDSEWKTKQEKEQEKNAQGQAAAEDEGADEANEDEDEDAVDPSDWVKEWVDDGLYLSLGVVAQNYVIERMGF